MSNPNSQKAMGKRVYSAEEMTGWLRDCAKHYDEQMLPGLADIARACADALEQQDGPSEGAAPLDYEPQPCCGQYDTCQRVCTPRGIEIGMRKALAESEAGAEREG